jgi:hypothetical protein
VPVVAVGPGFADAGRVHERLEPVAALVQADRLERIEALAPLGAGAVDVTAVAAGPRPCLPCPPARGRRHQRHRRRLPEHEVRARTPSPVDVLGEDRPQRLRQERESNASARLRRDLAFTSSQGAGCVPRTSSEGQVLVARRL